MDAQDAAIVQNILKLASFATDRLLFCVCVLGFVYLITFSKCSLKELSTLLFIMHS
jgi:hypothetical protein